MSSSSDSTIHQANSRARGRCCGGRVGAGNWSAVNIAAMVAGFVLFWPIGLFILFWIVTGRDVQDLPDACRRQWSALTGVWQDQAGDGTRGATDNVVFNEFQQAQYERIREIRDEIKERARRFREYRANAKRRADEEEFNRFMSDAPLRDGS